MTKKKSQITNSRNKKGDIITHSSDIKGAMKESYKQLYPHKFDNLGERYPLLKNHKLPKLLQDEIESLKCPK